MFKEQEQAFMLQKNLNSPSKMHGVTFHCNFEVKFKSTDLVIASTKRGNTRTDKVGAQFQIKT